MALTEQQKRLRALVFPGKRGKLDKHDQKIFAQMCAERGFPLDEATKPTSTRKAARRTSFKDDTSEEEVDIDDVDDEAELEEVVQEEQQEHEPPAGTQHTREIKTEVTAASDDEEVSGRCGAAPTASAGTAPAPKQRRRRTGRKGGRPSAMDTAAQALIGLTSSKSPLPAAAAAGRQRIAAVLPGAGFKPFAGVAMTLSSRQGFDAGQRSVAPYDYYEVYGTYLNCMELYSKAAGRLGADAVAAPIPPEELLGPAYASHLSTDPSAPHWTPPAAALEADAAAAQAAKVTSDRAARAAARAAAGNPDKQLAADTGPVEAAAAGVFGRGKRKMSAGVGDAVQAAAKRPYHRRSAAHKADAAAAAAGGDADEHDADQDDADLADDQQNTTAAAAVGTAPQEAIAAAVRRDRLEDCMNGTGSPGSQDHGARSGSTAPVAVAANGNGTATGGSSDVEMQPPPLPAVGLPSKDARAAVISGDGDDGGSQLAGVDDDSDVSDDSDSSSDSESEEGGAGRDTGGGSPATGDAPQQLQQDQRQEQGAQQQKAPLRPALQELLALQAQQPVPGHAALVEDI